MLSEGYGTIPVHVTSLERIYLETLKMVLALRCLALVILLIAVTSCPSDDQCHRKAFHDVSNRSYNGDVVLGVGPWPVNKCHR